MQHTTRSTFCHVLALAMLVIPRAAAGQSGDQSWTLPRTVDGQPDLQGVGASENLQLVERFTRVGPEALEYEITITDPTVWTRPWTAMAPLTKSEDAVYEYACHEGNIGMAGILSGTRAEERAAQANTASR